ncbi:MAG TPA: hypothetical protein VD997_14795 [Phycisphaerales bacterium]|nr:hypothetical protein [Phycisphaerales bacterium]
MKVVRVAGVLAAVAGTAHVACGQETAAVNLGGISISQFSSNPPDVVRTSTPSTVNNSTGYLYTFNPTVQGTGILGSPIIPNPTPLGDVLNTFSPGQYRTVFGAVRNPAGVAPTGVFQQTVAGTFSGLTISLKLVLDVQADRTARAAIRNITKPVLVGLNVTSGNATVTTFTPPPPVHSEWHFEGNLLSVRENGLAPTSGPSKLRYLDDPAFGTILGGPGSETVPQPTTPTGVTQAQSAFGTCSSFGLPLIGGVDDTVYRTSPPRNAGDPTNQAKSRGLGLALWPNTHDFWPDAKIGHWTMVWDLYIPGAAWASEWPVALIEDNFNNDSAADLLIRQVGGQASIGYDTLAANYVSAPAIQPGRWMRLAFVSDGYRTGQGRIFVDGTLVGTTNGDWVYNHVKSTAPTYGDVSTANPNGTPIPGAAWNSWGQFPSPWAQSPGTSNVTTTASTICLFADLQQRGESVYIANLFFADEALTDVQVAALGGANGRGVEFLRPSGPVCGDSDFNGDGDYGTDQDIEAFFACLGGTCCTTCFAGGSDFNGDGDAGTDQDIESFFRVLGGAAC